MQNESREDRTLRVLLVDDEASFREPLARHLESDCGYAVTTAAHAGEAREILAHAAQPFDVALVDDLLTPGAQGEPEYLGIDLLREIKVRWPETEVIIFTSGGIASALEALRAGAYRYLQKPVNLDELDLTIRIAAEQAHHREELERTRGMVGARTALAWMGMASAAQRHAIDQHALAIRDLLQLLQRDLDAGRRERVGERIAMIEQLVAQILGKPITLQSPAEQGLEPVLLNALVGERARQFWGDDPYNKITLELDLSLPESAAAKVGPEWLRRAFDVLVDNAAKAVSNRAVQKITIGTQLADGGCEIFVTDTGPGIPDEIRAKIGLERIEKPEDTAGLGMGLLLAQTIVQTYGGAIKVKSTGPGGTTMAIWLPLATPDREAMRA